MNLKVGRSFEPFALEAQLRHTNGHKNAAANSRGELNGFVLDLKWFPGSPGERQRLYVLTGIGHYWFAFDNSDDSIKGTGFNLGGGLEHFIEDRMSITADIVYTILKYNRFDDGNTTSDLDPNVSGDAVTAGVALNLYFKIPATVHGRMLSKGAKRYVPYGAATER